MKSAATQGTKHLVQMGPHGVPIQGHEEDKSSPDWGLKPVLKMSRDTLLECTLARFAAALHHHEAGVRLEEITWQLTQS